MTYNPEFQIDDVVRCINPRGSGVPLLKVGELFTVDAVNTPNVHLKNMVSLAELNCGSLYAWRFELVSRNPNNPNTMQTQPRLSNGRFASPNCGLHKIVPASVQPVGQLKRGALYRILGGSVARYKGTVDNVAVFKVHGKPIAVDESRVRLADKDDVQAYLKDAGVV